MNFTALNPSDHCLYVSCPNRSGSPALYILLYVTAAAVVLLTVWGNLLTIISVFHFKQIHTMTNMLILSLAVSDFLVGVLVMPPTFILIIESCWIFGTVGCTIAIFIGLFLVSLSVYQVTLIAVDRYFALSNLFLYNNIMSLRKMRVVIFSQWCMWISYSSALLYFNGNFNYFAICPGECLFIVKYDLVIIDFVTTTIFPCSVIIILYTGVFKIARKHAFAIQEINNRTQTQNNTNSFRSERKAAKVLGILVSVFLACLLPYCIYNILGQFTDLNPQGFYVVITIFLFNATINPIIYALFYPWFRRCVKIIITLKIFKIGSSLIAVID